jgi:hypothetical protein
MKLVITSTRTDTVSASMHISMTFSVVIRRLEQFVVILDIRRRLVVQLLLLDVPDEGRRNNTLGSGGIATRTNSRAV